MISIQFNLYVQVAAVHRQQEYHFFRAEAPLSKHSLCICISSNVTFQQKQIKSQHTEIRQIPSFSMSHESIHMSRIISEVCLMKSQNVPMLASQYRHLLGKGMKRKQRIVPPTNSPLTTLEMIDCQMIWTAAGRGWSDSRGQLDSKDSSFEFWRIYPWWCFSKENIPQNVHENL